METHLKCESGEEFHFLLTENWTKEAKNQSNIEKSERDKIEELEVLKTMASRSIIFVPNEHPAWLAPALATPFLLQSIIEIWGFQVHPGRIPSESQALRY